MGLREMCCGDMKGEMQVTYRCGCSYVLTVVYTTRDFLVSLIRSVLVTVVTTQSKEFTVLHFRLKAANTRRQACSYSVGRSVSRTVGQIRHRLVTNA